MSRLQMFAATTHVIPAKRREAKRSTARAGTHTENQENLYGSRVSLRRTCVRLRLLGMTNKEDESAATLGAA